jgi:uncharacterized protein (TIGR02147 family)
VDTVARVHVFAYVDYRAFLRDFYRAEKARNRRFSHRAFSRRAGLRSSNYLNLIVKGQRDLSAEMAIKFARGCGLVREDADYFCELVAFGQARTADERNRCHERLSRFRQFREAHKLDGAQASYHSTWYMPAIRELVARSDFHDDPKWIAAELSPPISPAQARDALGILSALKLLVRDADGRLRQADPLVTTGDGPLGHHVVNFHRAMMDQAKLALDRVPREERDISSLTLCVSSNGLARLKERIAAFRRELLQMSELEGHPERVVQINFQLFPLTRGRKTSDE